MLKAQLFSGYPLRHGFSTRHGGVSEGELASLNMSFSCGDEALCVRENRRRFFSALGSTPSTAVFCQQAHGNNVETVGVSDAGRGAMEFESGVPSCDGLITTQPNVSLNILTADCVAILFYDPVRHSVASCHAGWPGSAAGIADVVLAKMCSAGGSRPEDLLVAMGPSASGCCYEVDERVASSLEDNLGKDYLYKTARPGKYMVDLRIYNTMRLVRLGVRKDNIERVGGCSICGDEFFSHRRQAGLAGRMLASIELLHR